MSLTPMDYKKLPLKKIFLDRDKDGIVDTVNLQLHLSPSCSNPTVLSAVMDLSACLGFETMGMDHPLVKTWKDKDPSFHHHLYIGLHDELKEIISEAKEGGFFLGEEDERSLIQSINDFALSLISKKATLQKGFPIKPEKARQGFDLLNPFSNQGFYCRSFRNSLHVFSPYKIVLFSRLRLTTGAEASNFAARLGLEGVSLCLPLTFPLKKKPKKKGNFIYIGKKEDVSRKRASLRGKFCDQWDSGIFILPSTKKIPDVLICGDEKGLEKVLKHLSRLPMNFKGAEDSISRRIKKYFEELQDSILGRMTSGEEIVPQKMVKEYTIVDEKGEIINLLKEKLKKRRSKPNSVEIQILMTRPEKVRKRFKEEIRQLLNRSEVPTEKANVTVLSAYKPGFSWMKEVVLKEVTRFKIDRIEITFREFKAKGLEEPIRWLQEVYPIDEILSKDLSIPKEKIEFKKDSRIKEVYRVRAWCNGNMVYESQFSPKWVEQAYLPSFSRLGKVHPDTGWVMMNIDGEVLIDQRVKTGIERIWEIYQSKILPLIEKEANKVLSKRRPFSSRLIFEELRFDIAFDYPWEPLGVDEERISPLEALHEDLYFVTLNFFSNWFKRKRYKGISPGRVLPVIHPNFHGRNGRMKFTLIHQTEGSFLKSRKDDEGKIALNGIVFNRSKVGIDFTIGAGKEGKHRWLKGHLKSYPKREVRIPIEIPLERPIGYREGIRLIKSFVDLPGVNVVEEGRSFEGLPIYSIENTLPCPSTFVSHAKRALLKPTFFINCRHHANEVSSTNAGFRLSYLLASEPRFQRFLRKANIVINPMENVDGMVILEEMLKLTPSDKLHAARYHRGGQEFYSEYFNPKTVFGEARVKPAIWERWVPDICVDNHGFPSHEWEQPFSGYAPYQFREWWIARALFFIYLPHLEKKAGSSQRINAEMLGRWIAKYVGIEKKIKRWNHFFWERYSKYRQRWIQNNHYKSSEELPCLPLQKRFQRTNYSYRHPRITTIDFITEAADETAQGNFFKTCVSAHLRANLAIIKLLNYHALPVKKECLNGNGETHFIWYRERPLKF